MSSPSSQLKIQINTCQHLQVLSAISRRLWSCQKVLNNDVQRLLRYEPVVHTHALADLFKGLLRYEAAFPFQPFSCFPRRTGLLMESNKDDVHFILTTITRLRHIALPHDYITCLYHKVLSHGSLSLALCDVGYQHHL